MCVYGGIFRGRVKKKYCCVRGGGHNMKNKNIGGGVLSTQPDQQKGPNAKNAKKKKKKKKKKKSNIENFFLARFTHSAFYKIHFFGAANRHAQVQYSKYAFFSKQSS